MIGDNPTRVLLVLVAYPPVRFEAGLMFWFAAPQTVIHEHLTVLEDAGLIAWNRADKVLLPLVGKVSSTPSDEWWKVPPVELLHTAPGGTATEASQ